MGQGLYCRNDPREEAKEYDSVYLKGVYWRGRLFKIRYIYIHKIIMI